MSEQGEPVEWCPICGGIGPITGSCAEVELPKMLGILPPPDLTEETA